MSSPHYTFFLFNFVIFFVHINISVLGQESWPICNEPVYLGINKTNVLQDQCIQYFQLDIQNDLFKDKYVMIELNFDVSTLDYDFQPIFTGKIDEKAKLYNKLQSHPIQNRLDDGTIVDHSGLVYGKTYANIILTPEDIKKGNIAHLAVYNNNDNGIFNTKIEYEVKVMLSSNFHCPKDCNGHGICDQIHQKCICSPGFFDVDCGVQPELLSDNLQNYSIAVDTYKYFYIPESEFPLGGSLHIKKPQEDRIIALVSINEPGIFDLPNIDNYQSWSFVDNNDDVKVYTNQNNKSDNQDNRQIVIGLFNPGSNERTIYFGLQIEKGKTSVHGFGYVVILAIGVSLCTMMMLYKEKPHNNVVSVEQQELREMANGLLKENEFALYFPTRAWEQTKDSFAQNSCSICLEDFKPESECSQLYCKHIFHAACIKSWLIKHKSCPNCKEMMSKDAIDRFYDSDSPEKHVIEMKNLLFYNYKP